MSELIHSIAKYVLAHMTGCLFVAGLLGTAFASTYPDQRPKTLDEWWAWSRDFIHQLGNQKRPTIQKP